MQPGHEEVALAPEELLIEGLLLDESSFFAQEMTVKLKREMRIMYKILLIIFYSPVMRGNKFEKSHIHILESETLSGESRVTESAQELVGSIPCNCA